MYSAKTKCPSCGTVKIHDHLSSLGFSDENHRTTKCDCCGFTYPNRSNCIEIMAPSTHSEQSKPSPKNYLSQFPTDEILNELKRRGYKF